MGCSSFCVSDLDLAAALGKGLGNRGLAEDLAHRAFGRRFYGRLGAADVEQIRLRVLDEPEDGKVDVDDVLVAGQHQRLFGDLRGSPARPRSRERKPISVRLMRVTLGLHTRFDRRRQMPVEAGLRRYGYRRQSAARCQPRRAAPGRSRWPATARRWRPTRTASPVPMPEPPGITMRSRSWLRRSDSSKFGGGGPNPRGPGRLGPGHYVVAPAVAAPVTAPPPSPPPPRDPKARRRNRPRRRAGRFPTGRRCRFSKSSAPSALPFRALINEPAIVFADEPTAALDQTTGHQVVRFAGALSRTWQYRVCHARP